MFIRLPFLSLERNFHPHRTAYKLELADVQGLCIQLTVAALQQNFGITQQ